MRYLVGFVCVLAALVAVPQSASSQGAEEGTTSEPTLDEFAPSSEASPEKPWLRIELTPTGVELVPSPRRIEKVDPRVLRARNGLLGMTGLFFLGGVVAGVGAVSELSGLDVSSPAESSNDAAVWTGVALMAGGLVGMITSGIILHARKRKLRRQGADAGRPHHVVPGKVPEWLRK
ncbi:MAG: hypothetical protein JRE73_17010 [Deltaproteobacteria bacterium]|nr:hypothetical protein [Deltaproteobacteria bacterium]